MAPKVLWNPRVTEKSEEKVVEIERYEEEAQNSEGPVDVRGDIQDWRQIEKDDWA